MTSAVRPLSAWAPWMDRALALAALAEGRTSPNPMVGALVLAADGTLVGEGFHARAGEPHAEVGALRQAGARARGGTLVVTLEPCCHQGRTPPCCDAVIAAGLARVVVALTDPDPRVAGAGLARLRAAGLEVVEGVGEAAARRQNRAFLHRCQRGRPLGVLKWAMSLDGRTALANGASQWISGAPARHWVHALRARCDAVIVGGGTLRADNPLLTSRGRCQPEPLRVVLSQSGELPVEARLWNQELAPTLVAHGLAANAATLARLDACGIPRLPLHPCGPRSLLEALAERGCNQVLWECGPALAAAAVREGCVQELAAVIAPKLLGGEPARTPLGSLGTERLDAVWTLGPAGLRWLEGDLLWQAALQPPLHHR